MYINQYQYLAVFNDGVGVEPQYVMGKQFSEYWRDLANAGQMVMIYS
jgi:hypothetical protein